MSKKWRDHKHALKCRYFDSTKSKDWNRKNVPKGQTREQWYGAVEYWFSEQWEVFILCLYLIISLFVYIGE